MIPISEYFFKVFIKGTMARYGSVNPKNSCSWLLMETHFLSRVLGEWPKFYGNCVILGRISVFYTARPADFLISICWKYGDFLGYYFKWEEENPSSYPSKQFLNDWKNNLKMYKS